MNNVRQAIIDREKYEGILTDYTYEMRDRAKVVRGDALESFANDRNFSIEVLKECGIFYIGEMAEMLVPKYLEYLDMLGVISPTNKKPIFHNRFVIPIKNQVGTIQNLVGYSKEAYERYIYGTALYYRRRDTLWGLENLKLAYELGYAILVEGITDAIMLRSIGYKNSFAMCGTHKSEYNMRLLNRCRHGVIRIPDRDSAGERAVRNWDCNRYLTIYVNFQYKDVDEMCREEENRDWFKSYMEGCINWIKSDTHKGKKCRHEEVTVL